MAYDNKLDQQHAALVTAVGRNTSNEELAYAYLGTLGYTQRSLAGRLAAYALAAQIATTLAARRIGLSGLGPELLTNGDFSSATGWTISAVAPATNSIAAGVYTWDSPAGEAAYCRQTILEIGATYEIVLKLDAVTGGGIRLYAGNAATGAGTTALSTVGTHTVRLTNNGTDGAFFVTRNGISSGTIDSISVKRVL